MSNVDSAVIEDEHVAQYADHKAIDRSLTWSAGSMRAQYDFDRGGWISITSPSDPSGANFLLSPQEFPEYDRPGDSRWFGTVVVDVRDDSGAIHTVVLSGSDIVRHCDESSLEVLCPASDATLGLSATHRFGLENGAISWHAEIHNESGHALDIMRVGVPLPMDQFFRDGDQFKYECNVLRHACIIGYNSWLYWQKAGGAMPILLFKAMGDTSVMNYAVGDAQSPWGPRAGAGKTFEGLYTIYVANRLTDSTDTDSMRMTDGMSYEYDFRFGMATSHDDAERWLSDAGGFFLRAEPGMTLPVGQAGHVTIVSGSRPQLRTEDEQDVIGRIVQTGEYLWQADVTLGGYGRRGLLVGINGRESRIEFWGIERPEAIYQNHTNFITRNQWETDESDPCYHGLLMWDMVDRHRIDSSYNPHEPNWMAGGSDDIGLTPGLLLSEWNVYRPSEAQIRVLAGYCDDFIRDRLTEQPGYKVHRMVPWFEMFEPWGGLGVDDVWRAYNYVHVVNTLYNMYRIATMYRAQYPWLHEPSHYLVEAYRYAVAMFSYWMFPDGEGADRYANMGEGMMALHLSAALKHEGFVQEAEQLSGLVNKKARYFAAKSYPFGSEMAFDSTAYETVYAYGKVIDDERVMRGAMTAALSNRGRQPFWQLYMTDLRGCGDSSWNVSYMTQLGAWAIYDWTLERRHTDPELLRAWYASYLAGFSIYNSGGYLSDDPRNAGSSGWIFENRYGSMTSTQDRPRLLKGVVPESGESALGYFGGLLIAASAIYRERGNEGCGCDVVDDHSPLLALGCALHIHDGGYTVTPQDGLRVRFFDTVHDWAVTLQRDALTEVAYDETRNAITLQIENITADAHTAAIRVRVAQPTSYEVRVNNEAPSIVEIGDQWTDLELSIAPQGAHVSLVRQ